METWATIITHELVALPVPQRHHPHFADPHPSFGSYLRRPRKKRLYSPSLRYVSASFLPDGEAEDNGKWTENGNRVIDDSQRDGLHSVLLLSVLVILKWQY